MNLTKQTASEVIDAYFTGYVAGIEEVKNTFLTLAEHAAKVISEPKKQGRPRKVTTATMTAKRKPGRPKKA